MIKHQFISSKNDEIIIATENHMANIQPWLNLARTTGAQIKWWCPSNDSSDDNNSDGDGDNQFTELRDMINVNTRVVAISHCSNVLGKIRDIHAIGRMIQNKVNKIVSSSLSSSSSSSSGDNINKEREEDARYNRCHLVVDGVASTPHLFANLEARRHRLDDTIDNTKYNNVIDWYVISCHKLYGPHIGGLCGTEGAIQSLYNNNNNTSSRDRGCDRTSWCGRGEDNIKQNNDVNKVSENEKMDNGNSSRNERGYEYDVSSSSSSSIGNISGGVATHIEEIYKDWELGTLSYEACAGILGLKEYLIGIATIDIPQLVKKTCTFEKYNTVHHDCQQRVIAAAALPTTNGMTTTTISNDIYDRTLLTTTGEYPAQQQRKTPHFNTTCTSLLDNSITNNNNMGSSFDSKFDDWVVNAYNKIEIVEHYLTNMILKGLQICQSIHIINECTTSATIINTIRTSKPKKVWKKKCVPIVSFIHKSITSKDIVNHCLSNNIIIRNGSFLVTSTFLEDAVGMSTQLIKEHGHIVRISICHYNTRKDVSRLLKVLQGMEGW